MGALMFAAQVLLAPLPNIEVVSLLVIALTLTFSRQTLFIIATFVLLEGLLYGFGVWWLSYLYIWAILMALCLLFKNMQGNLSWAVLSGAFGLCFGALCALPYFFVGGLNMMYFYWVSGIVFDLTHMAGNFILCLLLLRPLRELLARVNKSFV